MFLLPFSKGNHSSKQEFDSKVYESFLKRGLSLRRQFAPTLRVVPLSRETNTLRSEWSPYEVSLVGNNAVLGNNISWYGIWLLQFFFYVIQLSLHTLLQPMSQ